MSAPLAPAAPERQPVDDASQVRVAVMLATRLARAAGFAAAVVDTIALAATELAQNLHLHAVGGELIVVPPAGDDVLVLLAVDRGPGVGHIEVCLADGYTTIGTMGIGLGTVRRLADRFDVVSEIGRGTVVAASFSRDRDRDRLAAWHTAPTFDVGAVGFPVPPELRNGDSWATLRRGSRLVVTVADGLGHGPDAAAASRAAVDALPGAADRDPVDMIGELSLAARHTRGAAVTVATVEAGALTAGGTVDSAGLGNVTLAVVAVDGTIRRAVNAHGTAGRGTPRTHAAQTPCPAGAAVVLHSDGMLTRWDLDGRAELLRHDAVVVAAVLWRDFARTTDDSCVVVIKAGTTR